MSRALGWVVVCGALVLPVRAAAQGIPAGQPLTFDAAVRQALVQAAILRAAAESARGAQDAVGHAAPWLNPVVDLRFENLGAPDPPRGPLADVFAIVEQPFELPAKRSSRRATAAAGAAVARTGERSVRAQVGGAAALAYLEAARARDLASLLDEQHDSVSELVRVLRARVEEGSAAEGDLRRLEVEQATIDLTRLRLRAERDRWLGRLGALLMIEAPPAPEQLMRPAPLPLPPAADALDAAVERRPDVTAARARVEQARAAAALERHRWLPDPTLAGGYKRTAGVDTAVAGVLLTLPMGDRNRAARVQADAAARAAEFELAAVRRQARADAASALSAGQLLTAHAAEASTIVAAADIAHRAVRSAFTEGAADIVRLLDGERAWLDARRAVTQLAYDALVAQVEARLAVGEEIVP